MVERYDSSEGNGEERERFWNDLDRIVDRVGNGYSLCVVGNRNEWVGDRVRVGITGALEFQEKMIIEE